jgi:hypothetical protein
MASELKNTRESGDEVSAMRRTLTIPLAVVSPGKDRERTAEINAELQADMVTLSTRSCHVVAEESVHGIGEQPDIVVKAIHDVVSASTVANGKPGC